MTTPANNSPTPAPGPSEFRESMMTNAGPNTVMPSGDEKVSQHGKRAALVAAILGGLVIGGLLVDGIFGSKPEPAKKKEELQAAPPPDPFVDFEAKERLEAAKLEEERKKRLAREKALREAQASEQEALLPPVGAPPVAAVKNAEDEIREQARLDDLKRALGAVKSSEMIVGGSRSSADSKAGRGADAGTATSTGARNVASSQPGATGGNSAMLSQLKQAIDRAKGGDGFSRDLKSADAANAVVGQSATARRAGGEPQPRAGDFLIPVGTVIPAILDMEVSSDWEGRWRGMITRDVYDISQDYILIPKGTRILGQVARIKPVNEAINERMALAAQWLVLPNGARIDLSRAGVLDQGGVAAIEGDVNRHYLATIGGVVAYGVVSGLGAAVANRADRNGGTSLAIAGANGSAATTTAGGEIAKGFTDLGHRIADRYLNLVPTITLKPGTSMNLFLDDEMHMQAWAPIDENSPPMPAPVAVSR